MLFRHNKSLKSQCRRAIPTVASEDSLDWKDLSAEEICSRIIPKVKSGSILLFHTDKENTHKALPMVIKSLKASGFEFVPVSDLIHKENFAIDANGEQYLLGK